MRSTWNEGWSGVNSSLTLRYYYLAWQAVRSHPLIFFTIFHAVLFYIFVLINGGSQATEFERSIAARMLEGQLPYVDFPVEYPPLAVLSLLLPALLSPVSADYSLAFAGEFLVIDMVILVLLTGIASHIKASRWEVLGMYTLFLLGIGPLLIIRHDLWPAMLFLAAIFAFIKNRTTLAWAIVALGVMSKFYPAILAPIFALWQLRERAYRKLFRGVAVFAAICIALSLPWLLLNAGGFAQLLTYHADRGLHSESIYGAVLMVGNLLGLIHATGEFTFGSWNLSSALSDSLAGLSFFIMAGSLLLVYISLALKLWKRSDTGSQTDTIGIDKTNMIVRYSVFAIVAFLLTSKVFSPQYLIWLCPLLCLVKTRFRYPVWALFLAAAGIGQYVFPSHYIEFELIEPVPVALMAVRNLLLVTMAILLVIPARKAKTITHRAEKVAEEAVSW